MLVFNILYFDRYASYGCRGNVRKQRILYWSAVFLAFLVIALEIAYIKTSTLAFLVAAVLLLIPIAYLVLSRKIKYPSNKTTGKITEVN